MGRLFFFFSCYSNMKQKTLPIILNIISTPFKRCCIMMMKIMIIKKERQKKKLKTTRKKENNNSSCVISLADNFNQ